MTESNPPPPSVWGLYGGLPSTSVQSKPAPPPGAADVELVASAWKHIRSLSSANDGRTPDFYDLLTHSVRETQYSFQPQGVSLLRLKTI